MNRRNEEAGGFDLSFIPPVTRYFVFSVLGLSLMTRFGIINPYTLVLYWDSIYKDFEIWRFLTSALFLPVSGFSFLLNMYFLYTYSTQCEKIFPDSRPDQYFYLLFFNWIIITTLALLIGNPLITCPSLIMAMIYIWSKYNANIIVTFWFGVKFKAMYFPFVLMGLNLVIGGGNIVSDILAILSGHLYYCLAVIFPTNYKSVNSMGVTSPNTYLPYPDIFQQIFTRFNQHNQNNQYFTGGGRRLG
ncbi:hypothetical protein A3Q56_00310 [Intoshia linei]|uniref:Derlin n=1 Tax=Intoshia linei TaxID=1819745 RepID=A0A177BEB1_9BILA|nr:hypothetical protein A3Q56_00310 [Intoshia linei]